ncbi:imidazole glycerol phosphate synthase subunit HisH [Pseudodesulfovibrio sp. zrk46]|uniref:imidazole glycerol phosphate synthase subunit HisH n=1 Tax=Pseudodesulfovibrio sp. zrk46 TaxID=2725288 RepID=UPI0014492594|nr:imidazole glycerol phosphate synthase subunit HisH [Pseudodesulfovibrio sp. zrk46]QJB58057.1 imidazole glycerol phosphate synthase subunit HisH [Pseudodesulfovibrio sp. zrk46]
MIGIIDYGMGNLASVRNALNSIGAECNIVSTPEELSQSDKAVLPGVGAFGDAMKTLNSKGFTEVIRSFSLDDKKPIMGICLGMQLMYEESAEFGPHPGLGLVEGKVLPLAEYIQDLSIPNIGWCQTERSGDSRLIQNLTDQQLCFYYVHSFFCRAEDRSVVTATLDYGTTCDAIIEKENIFACQFHPEKSQASGIEILKKFVEL